MHLSFTPIDGGEKQASQMCMLTRKHRWNCHDLTARVGSNSCCSKETDRKVKAPVAAGPPYPIINTTNNGPKANIAPITRSIFGVNRTITK